MLDKTILRISAWFRRLFGCSCQCNYPNV